MRFFAVVILLTTRVSADVCGDLLSHLGISLRSGSFNKNGVCHGLFWRTARGSGDICAHTTETRESCPNTHKVYVSEAEEVLARVRGEITATATTTRPSTTTVQVTSTSGVARRVVPVVAPRLSSAPVPYEILAFGDWGFQRRSHVLTPTARAIASRFTDINSIFLLGDNFYPSGILTELGLTDPAFNLFSEILAPSTRVNFYPVFGNHDHMGSVEAQLAYSRVHPQWVFPARYYFQRLSVPGGAQVCAWFLDTDRELFDEAQAAWLDESIAIEKGTCDWLVVSGHHPVFDAGEYLSNAYLIGHLLPILSRHRVHIYLSGHEHQSQVHFDGTTTFFIAGAAGDIHDKPVRGHEYLQYINTRQVAILRIKFYADRADFEYVATHQRDAPVIHSGSVRRH